MSAAADNLGRKVALEFAVGAIRTVHSPGRQRTKKVMYREPDTSQGADLDEVVQELFPPEQSEKHAATPLRFSLAQLLVATTIAAVLLALFRTLGIYGALMSFGAALIFTLAIYPAMKPHDRTRQALMFDFVWGVVMPVVCVVFDPLVFKGSEAAGLDFSLQLPNFDSLQPQAYFAYPAIAIQVIVMGLVLVIGRFPPGMASFLAGVLGLGMFVAGGIGIVLFPLSTLGLVVLVGALGYTPLLTAWAFARRAGELWEPTYWRTNLASAALGFVVATAVPIGVGALCMWLLKYA